MEKDSFIYNDNISKGNSQATLEYGAELRAYSAAGREIPFAQYKRDSLLLARLMRLAVPEKAVWFRMAHCGDSLIFGLLKNGDKRLLNANFCRARLCPMCQSRRSLKARAQMSEIVAHLREYRYIFLTLTLKNVAITQSAIRGALDDMAAAWQRLSQRKRVREMMEGFYKSIELTVDLNEHITDAMYVRSKKYYDARGLKPGDSNPNFYCAHPHMHIILCVNRAYFEAPGRRYISQGEWTEMWADALRIDYTPIVDVRKISVKHVQDDETMDMRAVLEVTKYCTKSSDLLAGDTNEEVRVVALRELYYGCYGKRFISLGGVIRDMHKQLELEDIEGEDADLADGVHAWADVVGYEGYIWRSGVQGGTYIRDAMTEKMYKALVEQRGY